MKRPDVIQELKKENDKRTIREIQDEIHNQEYKSRDLMIRRTKLLYYLERTSRFKEIKEYEKVTFETYIQHEYNLLYGTYDRERKAVLAFPRQVESYGVGLVAKVIKETKKPELALKAINGITEKGHKLPADFRPKVEKIIEKYAKPKKAKPGTRVLVCTQCDKYKEEIILLNKELEEKDEQITKLKAALNKRDLTLEKMYGFLKPFEHIVQPPSVQ